MVQASTTCFKAPFLPSSLLEADTIFYRAIITTWLFFSSLKSPCSSSLGCDVNVISFHMALQQANVTAESCSPLCSPPRSHLDGGLVKCIIYPCLPPWRGSHTRKVGLLTWIHCQYLGLTRLPCRPKVQQSYFSICLREKTSHNCLERNSGLTN